MKRLIIIISLWLIAISCFAAPVTYRGVFYGTGQQTNLAISTQVNGTGDHVTTLTNFGYADLPYLSVGTNLYVESLGSGIHKTNRINVTGVPTPASIAAQISTNTAGGITMAQVNSSMSSGTNSFSGNGAGLTNLTLIAAQIDTTGTDYSLTTTMTNLTFGTSGVLGVTNLPAGLYEFVFQVFCSFPGTTMDDEEFQIWNNTASVQVPRSDFGIVPFTEVAHTYYFPLCKIVQYRISTPTTIIAQGKNVSGARGVVFATFTSLSYKKLSP